MEAYQSRFIDGVLYEDFKPCTFEQYKYAYQYLGSDFVKITTGNIVDVFNQLASYFKPIK